MSRPIAPQMCLRCGKPLPVGCSRSRKYCPECGRKQNIELTVKRQQASREYFARKRAESREAADREFCRQCVYCGEGEYHNNLCDYMLRTGERRGCHYGVACTKRIRREEHELA